MFLVSWKEEFRDMLLARIEEQRQKICCRRDRWAVFTAELSRLEKVLAAAARSDPKLGPAGLAWDLCKIIF